jgi:hypothetical protein
MEQFTTRAVFARALREERMRCMVRKQQSADRIYQRVLTTPNGEASGSQFQIT